MCQIPYFCCQNVGVRRKHTMVWGSTYGHIDMCWHVSFALWVYDNGWKIFVHDVHDWIHPFQVWEWPMDVPNLILLLAVPPMSMRLYTWTCWYVLAWIFCLSDVWQWMDKLCTWFMWLDPFLTDLKVAYGCAKVSYFSFCCQNRGVRRRYTMVWVSTHGPVVICTGLFHLPCGCMTVDRQALYMRCMTGSIPSRRQCSLWMYPNLILLLSECRGQEEAHPCVRLYI